MSDVLRPDLLTIEGLNQAAGELGEGLLPFNSSYGFPVKYGCLLWIIYIGEYGQSLDEAGKPQVTWDTDEDTQAIGVVIAHSWSECREKLDLEDGDSVLGTVQSYSPVPSKVYVWATASDRAGMKEFCARKVPELRKLVLQHGWREKRDARRKNPTERPERRFWPEKSPPLQAVSEEEERFSVPAKTRCKVCGEPLFGEVRKWKQGYRHAWCFPHLTLVYRTGQKVTAPYISRTTRCPVCNIRLHDPIGGEIHRHGTGYRHADCSIELTLNSGRVVLAPMNVRCQICKKPLAGRAQQVHGGWRHPRCKPPEPPGKKPPQERVRVRWGDQWCWFTEHTVCRSCGKKLSGQVSHFEDGYRHSSCPIPPAFTLDKKGRPVYRHGGHRRKDGVWVCPPGAAKYGIIKQHTHVNGRPWVTRRRMLDEYNNPDTFGRSGPTYK